MTKPSEEIKIGSVIQKLWYFDKNGNLVKTREDAFTGVSEIWENGEVIAMLDLIIKRE